MTEVLAVVLTENKITKDEAKVRNLELLALPHGQEEPKHLTHHLFLTVALIGSWIRSRAKI